MKELFFAILLAVITSLSFQYIFDAPEWAAKCFSTIFGMQGLIYFKQN